MVRIEEIEDDEIPGLLVGLAGRLLQKKPEANGQEKDRGLDIKEAAARLGVSESWLYHNWKTLPFAWQEGRRLIFSEQGIERRMKEKQEKADSF